MVGGRKQDERERSLLKKPETNETSYSPSETYLMYWATHLNPSLNPILRTTEHI